MIIYGPCSYAYACFLCGVIIFLPIILLLGLGSIVLGVTKLWRWFHD